MIIFKPILKIISSVLNQKFHKFKQELKGETIKAYGINTVSR